MKIQMKLNAFDSLQSNGYQECQSHAEKRKSQITNYKLNPRLSPGQPSVESVPVTRVVIVTVELLQLLHYLIQLLPSNTHVIRTLLGSMATHCSQIKFLMDYLRNVKCNSCQGNLDSLISEHVAL